ncbi:MAG: hypothetical protein AMJ46_12715 [Latescibacteria bacterium DG_63]|nr:MAG: hypothetical protein AMJ46_12715 [Latescibacteria bacterium DG_63]
MNKPTLKARDLFYQPILRWREAVQLRTDAGQTVEQIAQAAIIWAARRGATLSRAQAILAVMMAMR